MDKAKLLKLCEQKIKASLETLVQSAMSAHEAATHTESKAEDQYDTRGLEASYLAGAQSRRAIELEGQLALIRFLELKTFGPETPIASTALIELEQNGKSSWCFLLPKVGGIHVELEGHTIQVISPQSPLGAALLGRRVGDDVEIEIQRIKKEFVITRVL